MLFFLHAFAFVGLGSSKIKKEELLVKCSPPIGMFAAAQFWVVTHRLIISGTG
jgi:hypothetical protein